MFNTSFFQFLSQRIVTHLRSISSRFRTLHRTQYTIYLPQDDERGLRKRALRITEWSIQPSRDSAQKLCDHLKEVRFIKFYFTKTVFRENLLIENVLTRERLELSARFSNENCPNR